MAGVSHELRTPLAVICAAGDNLAAGVVTDPATAREYGRVVRDEGRRLAEMVERVLDLAGSYSGHRKWRLEDVDVEPVLRSASRRSSRWRVSAASGSRASSVDRYRACAPSAPPCGVPWRTCCRTPILHGGDGGFVGLRAESSGPMGQRRSVSRSRTEAAAFPQPRCRTSSSPSSAARKPCRRQTRGSGLGLSLVKRIADAHGGAVEVTTAPGRGSAFTLVLPAVARSHDDPPHTAG